MREDAMELRPLKHFLAVGEAGSITAAAKQLRLTRPAPSRQIKALEEQLAPPSAGAWRALDQTHSGG
jgi:hypothetical protein